MPVATDGHISSNGDGLMHRHGPDPPTGPNPEAPTGPTPEAPTGPNRVLTQ
ncbi:hypothetical protein [Streptomyces sp. NPDC127066]|uniref:hypothetical protein n=1 Tax=Streptomyces sp. NPDC127066 TaxID=3347125 RepID=UPI00366548C3